MGSQPPYGSYPSSGQPWPEQPSEPAAPSYGQPGAYPPPPSYGAAPYPSQPGQAPYPPSQPLYGYTAPNIYVQPAAYVVAAPADPGSGPAVTSLVLGIVGTVSAVLVSWLVCLSFIPIILGIVGFIMGILGFKSKTRHGMAVAGFILSIIAVAIPIVIFIIYVVADAAMYATPQ
jgi:hypothetical protein